MISWSTRYLLNNAVTGRVFYSQPRASLEPATSAPELFKKNCPYKRNMSQGGIQTCCIIYPWCSPAVHSSTTSTSLYTESVCCPLLCNVLASAIENVTCPKEQGEKERKSDTDSGQLSEKGGIATPGNNQVAFNTLSDTLPCQLKKSNNINHINYFTFMLPATMPHREIVDTISMRTISPRFTSRTRLILHIHFRFNFEESRRC